MSARLDAEILTFGQLYRARANSENDFDETKNRWGWGCFTTRDLKHCRLMARFVALAFNSWNVFARLADPEHRREAITSRPLLLTAIGRQTTDPGQTTFRVSSAHAKHAWARAALTRIGAFLESLRSTAERLTPIERWYRILSEALVKYLKGRQLDPPACFRRAVLCNLTVRRGQFKECLERPTAGFRLISSDGGMLLLLLAGADKRLGLVNTLAAIIPDHRDPDRIVAVQPAL